jgi:integrase
MNARKLVDFRGSYHYCYQHVSLTRKPRSKYWFACFRDLNGKQRRRSTRQTDRKKALKVAEQLSRLDDVNLLLGQSGKVSPSSTAKRSQWRQYANSLPTGFRRKNRKYLLERDGYIGEDPAEFVETVRKSSEQARRPFTTSEIQRVISVADAAWKSLILFGLYTGQRLADIATLTWDHVDLSRNEIRLRTRKTAKRLTIPIAAPLRTHLDSLAVAGERGSPIHPRAFGTMRRQGKSGNLSNQFSDILAKAWLRQKAPHRSTHKGRGARRTSYELSFHSLRHTAVSLLKDAGIPEAAVMELVGHDSKQMSAHYTHVGREALEKAAAAFPEL